MPAGPGAARPVEHGRIDRPEAAAHVARHRALAEGQEDDAAGVACMVEVVARRVGIAVEAGPAHVEVEPVGGAVAARTLETDHVVGRDDDVVADDDLARRRRFGVAGQRDGVAVPLAGGADGDRQQRKRGEGVEHLHHEAMNRRCGIACACGVAACVIRLSRSAPVPSRHNQLRHASCDALQKRLSLFHGKRMVKMAQPCSPVSHFWPG